uniref:Transcriptional regulator n=1 Tax=Streptomyces sp. NBC_00180 TaxID=2903632 RepID=A0AAU1HQA8_9ACTN
METWFKEDADALDGLISDCGQGLVQATVMGVAGSYGMTEDAVRQWLESIFMNATHPAVEQASAGVAMTEVDGWDNAAWSGWLRAVCIQAGYPMTANPPSGQDAFPGPVPAPQQQTQGTGYVWTPDPAPQPAPAGHPATTTVYQNQDGDGDGDGDRDQSDDAAVLSCVRDPQLQTLTFDALAAHLAQWDFTRERVQHSLARIAYNSNVNLQGLNWNQAWNAIAANEQALSLEAMVDACLAQRRPLHKALTEISGTAHVQQIDVANYIITLARHRLNRPYTDHETAYHDLQRTIPQPPPPTYTWTPDPDPQPQPQPQPDPQPQPQPQPQEPAYTWVPDPQTPAPQSSSGQSRPGKRKQPAPDVKFTEHKGNRGKRQRPVGENAFSQKMWKLREEVNLSQDQIAKNVGVARIFISKGESGSYIDPDMARRWIQAVTDDPKIQEELQALYDAIYGGRERGGEDAKQAFPERMRQLRVDGGFRLLDVEAAIGISKSNISNWERGSTPTAESDEKINGWINFLTAGLQDRESVRRELRRLYERATGGKFSWTD